MEPTDEIKPGLKEVYPWIILLIHLERKICVWGFHVAFELGKFVEFSL